MNTFPCRFAAAPSFWEGMGRLFDFGGTLSQYNFSETPEQADSLAIRSDWMAIGGDISAAIRSFEAKSCAQETAEKILAK